MLETWKARGPGGTLPAPLPIGDPVTDEEPGPEIVPDEEADAAAEPDAGFGEQDEDKQAGEWEEDALEGGA